MSTPNKVRRVSVWLKGQNANESPAIVGYTSESQLPLTCVNNNESVLQFFEDKALCKPMFVNFSEILSCVAAEYHAIN